MSLYADYLIEREGKSVLELEHGFAVYQFLGDTCYIVDIYVKPQHRKSGYASIMADKIAKLAKEKGYNKLLGSVDLRANGCTISMKALLGYGFNLKFCDGQTIFLEKEI